MALTCIALGAIAGPRFLVPSPTPQADSRLLVTTQVSYSDLPPFFAVVLNRPFLFFFPQDCASLSLLYAYTSRNT